ncbi:MAG: zf-HC2 domain-containing protein [Candidatus Krumholzibacteriia bacterium]
MNDLIDRCPQGEAVSCQWGVLASAYFDNELEPPAKRWFEEHLFCCNECALDLEAFQTLQSVIRSIGLEGDPVDPRDLIEDATRN